MSGPSSEVLALALAMTMRILDELVATATAVLGAERAEQLSRSLDERAQHIERVLAVALDASQPTASRAHPPAGSVPAAHRASARITELDDRVRAWAWRAPGFPEPSPAPVGTSLPLDGYAMGVKDVIDAAGAPTRAGSSLTSPDPVTVDAPVVERLRAAGAAIVGKTACTEWALNDPAPTRNPWDEHRTPGGSSAGSGVAVALGMCRATVDTQTAGDVLRPAAYAGVVGFKPTIGWASIDGTRCVAPTIDTIGVMARRVGDAATVAAAVSDGARRFLPAGTSSPPRIAQLVDDFFDAPPEMTQHIADVFAACRDAGATIDAFASPSDLWAVHAAHRVVTFAECAAVHFREHDTLPDRFGPRARELLDLGRVTPAYAYARAQEVRAAATRMLTAMLDDVDAMLLPVVSEPPPDIATTGDARFQIPWTLCGFPCVAVPSGMVKGLPVAVQLVGAPARESRLLTAAAWCEHVFDVNLRPPEP